MKEENKQIYYQNMSLEELTNEANRIIDYLENVKILRLKLIPIKI
jgi:hypothetical protein